MTTSDRFRDAADKVQDSRALEFLARGGFAASGLVHLLLGYLAIRVATQHEEQTDQAGALAQLAALPAGAFILWATAIGLAALALWMLIEAVLGVGSASKKRWVRSIKPAAKGIAYLALAWTAVTTALGTTSQGNGSTQASASVLALPGGPFLLGIIGLIAIGVGGYLVVKGVRTKFRDDITIPSGTAGRTVTYLGILGYVAKGIAIVVVGVLFMIAAVKLDPNEGSGLDGALKALLGLPFGQWILIAVGIGLICYGVYSFARARFARL